MVRELNDMELVAVSGGHGHKHHKHYETIINFDPVFNAPITGGAGGSADGGTGGGNGGTGGAGGAGVVFNL
jgi:hypothetical protein